MLNNQKNLRKFYRKYEVNDIINDIRKGKRVEYYKKNMYERVLNQINLFYGIEDLSIEELEEIQDEGYLIIELNGNEVYEILLKNDIIYEQGRKVKVSPIKNNTSNNIIEERNKKKVRNN